MGVPAELCLWQLGDTLGLEAKQAASWKQGEADRWLWLLHLFIHLFTSLFYSTEASYHLQNASSGTGPRAGE